MNEPVLILMSTYNGAKFISDQIESLLKQTHENWQLLIRDDGSNDKTTTLIHYFMQHDHRISQINDHHGNVGTKISFGLLMENALNLHHNYIFFCDQDDVWLPNKLEKTLYLLQTLEQQHGSSTPVLVHTDLSVVNERLHITHPSFIAHENLRWNADIPLNTLLINNYVTGCTVGMNRALLQRATPMPFDIRMHDWWCALIAASCGKIGFINEGLLLYRQHNSNVIGSKSGFDKLKSAMKLHSSIHDRIENLQMTFKQADELSKCINTNILINQFANLPNQSFFDRYKTLSTLNLKPASRLRSMMLWGLITFI